MLNTTTTPITHQLFTANVMPSFKTLQDLGDGKLLLPLKIKLKLYDFFMTSNQVHITTY